MRVVYSTLSFFFLITYPDSELADNAQYWRAEASYVTNDYEEALAQFQVVLSKYPRSRKLPDALLKIGYSNYELGRWAGARSALEKVRDDFPDSTAARLAEELRLAGVEVTEGVGGTGVVGMLVVEAQGRRAVEVEQELSMTVE